MHVYSHSHLHLGTPPNSIHDMEIISKWKMTLARLFYHLLKHHNHHLNLSQYMMLHFHYIPLLDYHSG